MRTEDQAMALYKAYPRKVARGAALNAIKKALMSKDSIGFDALMDAVQEYAKAKKGQDRQYIPHPSTWFNQERWDDDRDEWWEGRRPDIPAETAWEKVREAISRFGLGKPVEARESLDGPTISAVKKIGWQNLCSMTEFNRGQLFQQFKTQYEKEATNATRNSEAVSGADRERQDGVREIGEADPGSGPREAVRGALREVFRDRSGDSRSPRSGKTDP